MLTEKIVLAHGSGGAETASLMEAVFAKRFKNEILDRLEDSAVIAVDKLASGEDRKFSASDHQAPGESILALEKALSCGIAVSTDSYVVKPLVFPGGDIGKLAVCGTVNDVLMSGAVPKWLTCGFIIEAGLDISVLDNICASMAMAAAEAGVTIIAGDTKVIEGKDEEGGLIINTTGIGLIRVDHMADISYGASDNSAHNASDNSFRKGIIPAIPSPAGIRPGDMIIVSGNLGDHHAAILSARMGVKNNIKSDCAILSPIVKKLTAAGVPIHAMRDVTRGGLATVLNELAAASGITIEIEETKIPVNKEVRAFCGIMGLDPLYMGNEGKMVLAVRPDDAARALALIRETEIGKDAAIVGAAAETTKRADSLPSVILRTRIGGRVRLNVLYGEGLPRIC